MLGVELDVVLAVVGVLVVVLDVVVLDVVVLVLVVLVIEKVGAVVKRSVTDPVDQGEECLFMPLSQSVPMMQADAIGAEVTDEVDASGVLVTVRTQFAVTGRGSSLPANAPPRTHARAASTSLLGRTHSAA